ncbi:MAG: glucose-6-phosphate isomerase [Pseudomonadota bacterium]
MIYQQDITRCLSSTLGATGLTEEGLETQLRAAEGALSSLREDYDTGGLPLLRLPEKRDDLAECRRVLESFLRGADHVLVFGTGGSSLGGQALAQLAGYRIPGPAAASRTDPDLHFFDNLDGHTLALMLRDLELKTTRFIVISKSGGTPETITQCLTIIEALKEGGLEWNIAQHVLALTQPGTSEENALRRLAGFHDIRVLDHDPNVGGRFSVLSNVGMLPALVAGLDTEGLREGAAEALAPVLSGASAADCAPAVGAAVNTAFAQDHGHTAAVMMPYSDRLRLFSNWFAQLWAESLGKEGKGTSPIAAAGPVDQHSLFQLFNGGPKDKLVTIIMTASAGAGPRVAEAYASDPLVGYLATRTAGDLTDAQQRATAETLARNGRAVRTISIGEVNERSLGALLMHFMLETIIAGHLMGVNPFDQPSVEESKVLTREYLETM